MKTIATDVCKAAANMGKAANMRNNESDISANDEQENVKMGAPSKLDEENSSNESTLK